MQLDNHALARAAKRLWRVLVGVAFGQIAGFVIFRATDFPSATNLLPAMSSQNVQETIGASLGTVVGFLLGAKWHKASTKGQDIRYIRILGVLAALISLPGLAFLVTSVA